MIYMFFVGLLGVMMTYTTLFFRYRSKSVVPENFLENYLSEQNSKEEKEDEISA